MIKKGKIKKGAKTRQGMDEMFENGEFSENTIQIFHASKI